MSSFTSGPGHSETQTVANMKQTHASISISNEMTKIQFFTADHQISQSINTANTQYQQRFHSYTVHLYILHKTLYKSVPSMIIQFKNINISWYEIIQFKIMQASGENERKHSLCIKALLLQSICLKVQTLCFSARHSCKECLF